LFVSESADLVEGSLSFYKQPMSQFMVACFFSSSVKHRFLAHQLNVESLDKCFGSEEHVQSALLRSLAEQLKLKFIVSERKDELFIDCGEPGSALQRLPNGAQVRIVRVREALSEVRVLEEGEGLSKKFIKIGQKRQPREDSQLSLVNKNGRTELTGSQLTCKGD